MATIIVDPGSTHMGKLSYAKEHIKRAAGSGASIIKFQLFKNPRGYHGGNIELPLEWWDELKECADLNDIELTASVFDEKMLKFLVSKSPNYIKFSYSKRFEFKWHEVAKKNVIARIISCDVMSDRMIDDSNIKLYCIPEYPVRYEICFDELFPRFSGFSSHCMGIRQDIHAIRAGAKYLEKHTTLPHMDISCPDDNFAVHYNKIEQLKMVE